MILSAQPAEPEDAALPSEKPSTTTSLSSSIDGSVTNNTEPEVLVQPDMSSSNIVHGIKPDIICDIKSDSKDNCTSHSLDTSPMMSSTSVMSSTPVMQPTAGHGIHTSDPAPSQTKPETVKPDVTNLTYFVSKTVDVKQEKPDVLQKELISLEMNERASQKIYNLGEYNFS